MVCPMPRGIIIIKPAPMLIFYEVIANRIHQLKEHLNRILVLTVDKILLYRIFNRRHHSPDRHTVRIEVLGRKDRIDG